MTIRGHRFLFFLIAVFSAPTFFNSPATAQVSRPGDTTLRLSRREAMDVALRSNPALLASNERVGQARAGVVSATAFADPTLAIDRALQTQPFDPRTSHASDQAIGATIPLPGRRNLRRSVATADLKVAEFDYTQLRQQVAFETAQAYDALLVAMKHREDLEQAKVLATDFLAKTRARFQAGTVPRLDVLKAEVEVDGADNDLIANTGAIAAARAALNRLLGRNGGAPLEPTDTLEVPASIAEIEQLEKMAEESRPELKSIAAQIEGARAATTLAKQYWLPDLAVSLERNAVQGIQTTYTSAIGFGFPLFFWQHNAGDLAVAQHREAELTATVSDLRSQVSVEVQTAYTNASTALRQAIFIRDHLLPEAREVYRIASATYGLGGSSALELLDAKRTLLDAQDQYAEALGAANDAQAALELAIGNSLPTVKPGEHP
jgi:cobalt-zinc-cadmium efflux system outer membrane protein